LAVGAEAACSIRIGPLISAKRRKKPPPIWWLRGSQRHGIPVRAR
jgi:hypothetical protein